MAAAWPIDEIEGLLVYCEQLKEQKLAAERQLVQQQLAVANRAATTIKSLSRQAIRDLVPGDDELGEGRAEGDLAGRGGAGGDADHVLFGDAALEKPLLQLRILIKILRIGGIPDIAIKGDNP